VTVEIQVISYQDKELHYLHDSHGHQQQLLQKHLAISSHSDSIIEVGQLIIEHDDEHI
jgi:hypothetical protein